MTGRMRNAGLALFALLAACSDVPDKGYTIAGQHGPLTYVLLNPTTQKTETAWREVAREVCGSGHICNIKPWTDPARVARGYSMTGSEADGIEAAYLVNRSTGADGFVCHPFGEAGQRCTR